MREKFTTGAISGCHGPRAVYRRMLRIGHCRCSRKGGTESNGLHVLESLPRGTTIEEIETVLKDDVLDVYTHELWDDRARAYPQATSIIDSMIHTMKAWQNPESDNSATHPVNN